MRRAKLATEIWPKTLETRELETGYAFRFDFRPVLFNSIAELVTIEHFCCPFLEIELRLEKNTGQIWLQLTGEPGVKQFIQAEMSL